ncbi:immediate early response 2b [Thalassophryne amazonica]|uniref:immediate early response 2b n=1 Tax=Thalassophryne amazonica TaxID=390379 RepID=UPI001470C79E|nr:immediate early response 2b [Thalassophryne amazonica]
MSAAATMEVNAEARRILAVSISKLYAARTQRGGLRLHRSLLLSLVMRSARDIYHSSTTTGAPPASEEPMDTSPGTAERAELAESHPELNPPPVSTEEPADAEEVCEKNREDKENLNPARQSRKRRGKAAAAPDFLPSKRARLEPGEERYDTPPASCRSGFGDCLTALSLNRVIPAF